MVRGFHINEMTGSCIWYIFWNVYYFVLLSFRTDIIFQVAEQLSHCSLVEPLLLPSNLLTLFCRYLDKRTVHQLKSNMEWVPFCLTPRSKAMIFLDMMNVLMDPISRYVYIHFLECRSATGFLALPSWGWVGANRTMGPVAWLCWALEHSSLTNGAWCSAQQKPCNILHINIFFTFGPPLPHPFTLLHT